MKNDNNLRGVYSKERFSVSKIGPTCRFCDGNIQIAVQTLKSNV